MQSNSLRRWSRQKIDKIDKIETKFDKIETKFDLALKDINTQFSGLRQDLISYKYYMALTSTIGRLPVEIAVAQAHYQSEHDATVYDKDNILLRTTVRN
jgi:hypothetical protein